ncbi:unnamed protein product [Symbiodinium sp. CCMP2592]|nr:unnamed protein product [Symbiodinium sp. CCMP2592]
MDSVLQAGTSSYSAKEMVLVFASDIITAGGAILAWITSKHCSNHVNLRADADRWTRQEYGCKSEYFHYRATNGDCGCATDTCDDQTDNWFWAIYVVEKGATATPLVPIPSPVYSLVQDGHHCREQIGNEQRHSTTNPAISDDEGGDFEGLTTNPAISDDEGGDLEGLTTNPDCGCARDDCNEKTEQSNWAIYKSTAPHLWKMGALCDDYINLRAFSLWSMPGSLESCRDLAAARTGNECSGTYFMYASHLGDCVCATKDCQVQTSDESWDIYILNVMPTASASRSVEKESLFTLGLVIAFLTL